MPGLGGLEDRGAAADREALEDGRHLSLARGSAAMGRGAGY